ncbi:hypothetical protein [Sorangium atrum]|uniref:Uncharacterized protein n=1 Tax=Sorangium atrum TaxID=2995308 RepID=A0ABT5BTI8_9BACT|nr:hypothetical protein [Sorangium aterium]MDC0676859.1 hypothetical protein [Sorangium aterium]
MATEIPARLGFPLEAPECRAREPTEGTAWSDGSACGRLAAAAVVAALRVW